MQYSGYKRFGECEAESTPAFKLKDIFQQSVGVSFRVEIEGEVVSKSKMVELGRPVNSMLNS
jgi:hypothetical protein